MWSSRPFDVRWLFSGQRIETLNLRCPTLLLLLLLFQVGMQVFCNRDFNCLISSPSIYFIKFLRSVPRAPMTIATFQTLHNFATSILRSSYFSFIIIVEPIISVQCTSLLRYKLLFSMSRSCLGDSLLMANTIFQKALLQVRSICENACSSGSGLAVESEAICLVDTDWYLTMTLDDFCERQRLQVMDACQKLHVLQKRVVEILCAACEVRVNH